MVNRIGGHTRVWSRRVGTGCNRRG